jgi:hypothetical protein
VVVDRSVLSARVAHLSAKQIDLILRGIDVVLGR